MAGDASFDFSSLTQLAADLGQVADNAGPFLRSAIEVTSVKTKKAAQKSVGSGNKRWKALPSAIDYEVTVEAGIGGSSISSDIGYNRGRPAGRLGNVREYGTPRVAPHNDLLNALHENEKDFVHGVEEALKDAERSAGL